MGKLETRLDPVRKNNVKVLGKLDSGKTLVFIHGFGTDQRAWDKLLPAFADAWRIVLIDNVGAGGAAPGAYVQSEYLSMNAYADDTIAVCDALNLSQAVLVGHSMGAMIAMLVAVRRPDLVGKLAFIGASPRYRDDDGYRGGFKQSEINDLYHALETWDVGVFGEFARQAMECPDKPHLANDFARSLRETPKERLLTTLFAVLNSDYRDELAKVAAPTLIIQTRHDFAVPMAVAEYMATQIHDSRIEVIDACGHFPHVSAPQAVVAALRRFV